VEVGHLTVLGGHRHDVEVGGIADRLEVAADDERVDAVPIALLA
jgi:hypothetical protein